MVIYPIVCADVQTASDVASDVKPIQIFDNFVEKGGWPKSFVDNSGNKIYSLVTYHSCVTCSIPHFEIKNVSLAINGKYGALAAGGEAAFASTVLNQIANIINVPVSFLGDYRSQVISSSVTLVRFNVSYFDSQARQLADFETNVDQFTSTFYQLLNSNALNLVGVDGRPLSVDDPVRALGDFAKIIIVGDYSAYSAAPLAATLAEQTALALNFSVDKNARASIVLGNLYDAQTNLSNSAAQLSFYSIQNGQLARLQALVASSGLQLKTPSGSACAIPHNQDLQGSVAYDLVGSPTLLADYFNLTKGEASMSALLFGVACFAKSSVSIEQMSATFADQLQQNPNIFHAHFNATLFATKDAPCVNNSIQVYPFKLTILNEWDKTTGADPGPFQKSMQQQLIQVLKIPPDNFISISAASVDLSGICNGQSALLFPQAIQLTFNLLTVPQETQVSFTSIMCFYEEGDLSLTGVNDEPLNIPAQYCQGTLKSALIIQTLAFAITGDNQAIVGTSEDQFASCVNQQLINKINLPANYLKNYQVEKGGVNSIVYTRSTFSSFSDQGVIDISQANTTFYQLLDAGNLNLMNTRNEPLKIRNLNDVVISTPLSLIFIGKIQPEASANLSDKLSQQLSDFLQVPDTSLANPNVLTGELFHTSTNISTRIINFSANLLSSYSNYRLAIGKLNHSLTAGELKVQDLNNTNLRIPVSQDLQICKATSSTRWPLCLQLKKTT